MELRCWFRGISIEVVDDAGFLREFPSQPMEMIEPGNVVYLLRGENWRGFVVGGIVRTHEDTGEYGDPSVLIGN